MVMFLVWQARCLFVCVEFTYILLLSKIDLKELTTRERKNQSQEDKDLA